MPHVVQTCRTAAPVQKPEWQETSIIFRDDCGTVRAVDGWRYGTLGVHATQDGDLSKGVAEVTVTHLTSKIAIIRVTEVEDALAVAERLWELCRPAFCSATDEPDRSKIPEAVVGWIKRCNQERKLVDGEPS